MNEQLSRPTDVLRKSGLLLVARAFQALAGVASFVILTRTLHPDGFGEVATALGVAGVLGGTLSAALSDVVVVSRSELVVLAVLPRAGLLLTAIGCAAAWPLSGRSWNLPLAIAGIGVYVAASAANASVVAAARREGNARGLAGLNAAGSLATLAVIFCLAAVEVTTWGAYVLTYAAQPLALLLLPRREPSRRAVEPTFSELLKEIRVCKPFLLSQSSWLVFGQANVFMLRLIRGPEAVGHYAGMTRILDLLAILGPLMGSFALPAFTSLHESSPGGSRAPAARLNLVIAAAGTVAIAAGIQFGWLAWRAAFPNDRFPSAVFALLACAYGISTACGLPDRVLQATGQSDAVGKAAGRGAVTIIILSAVGVAVAGLEGAAAALLLAAGGMNVFMLAKTMPSGVALAGHLWLGVVVAASAAALVAGAAERSLAGSSTMAAAAAGLVLIGSLIAARRLRAIRAVA